jgi:hypothetical protein
LDTFDALGARFDIPITKEEFTALGLKCKLEHFEIALAFNGYVLRGKGKKQKTRIS